MEGIDSQSIHNDSIHIERNAMQNSRYQGMNYNQTYGGERGGHSFGPVEDNYNKSFHGRYVDSNVRPSNNYDNRGGGLINVSHMQDYGDDIRINGLDMGKSYMSVNMEDKDKVDE